MKALWSDKGHGFGRRRPRSGVYSAYLPDHLHGRPLHFPPRLRELADRAERVVSQAGRGEGAAHLSAVGPMLTSMEAAASSWIEGIRPRAQQVAFAELALDEDIRGFGDQARLVAKNVAILRAATEAFAAKERLDLRDIIELQALLLGHVGRTRGLREGQNWIGGSSRDPLDAAYVPPPPEHVSRLMSDLVTFINDGTIAPLIQAALAHAQFETIHPFADGNGRVGRALIHTILTRRGLTSGAVLPVSLVLATRKDEYLAGLAAFRHEGPPDGAGAQAAVAAWLEVFLSATIDAAAQARVIARDIRAVRDEWDRRLAEHRTKRGMPPRPRARSASRRLLEGLLEAPVMTVTTAHRVFGLSTSAASAALTELASARVVAVKHDRGRPVYVASDLLALLDISERRLASPAFDTQVADPVRPTPTRGRDLESEMEPKNRPTGSRPSALATSADWSPAARSVWAKTDRNDDTLPSLSLVQHLEDTAAVAGALWDHWLAPNVKRVISEGLPRGASDGRTLVTWAAGVHDIGKATPGFAVKASAVPGYGYLVDRMAEHGLSCPPHTFGGGEKLPPHCRLGHFVLAQWLADRHDVEGSRAHALAIPIGAHHGSPPTALELGQLRGSRWTGRSEVAWRWVQFEILDGMARRTGAAERFPAWALTPPRPTAQALISATVVVADWLASDTQRFPYEEPASVPTRLTRAELGRDLLGPWRPRPGPADADARMAARFPHLPATRPIQRAVHDLVADIQVPSLVVIEAAMGVGKTEAALLAAEALAGKFGCGGVFVALPTMATSDAMFGRVLAWTRHVDSENPASIFLAHGKARLNEDYRNVIRTGRVHGLNAHEGHAEDHAGALVTSWLQGRRKGVLANMVIGTIDQVLFGALKARHLALRHLALAGKVVIIDEVHAADAFMRRYLVRVLEWLAAYGVPVILMSATLPPAQRGELLDAYARGRGASPTTPPSTTAYPLITIQGDRLTQHAVPMTGPSAAVTFSREDDTTVDALVTSHVAEGACVVIIRNTVQRAQETYAALREALGARRVMLLHSRLVAAERAARERRLLELLGPGRESRPHGFVVIGTQVLEQSLDIDADVMISDLAPIDLVLQRAGRLHRHQRGAGQSERPPRSRTARLHLTGVKSWATEPPRFEAGVEKVYGRSRLYRAAAVLGPHLDGAPVDLPGDISDLVATGYDPELRPPSTWAQPWAAADRELLDQLADQRRRASTFRIGEPNSWPSLLGWLEGRTDDSEDVGGSRAQVRDTEDSLEVVVVWRDADGSLRLLPGDLPHAGAKLGLESMDPPPGDLALVTATYTVSLPAFMTRGSRMDRVIRHLEVQAQEFTGWQRSPWLAGQLVLVLDSGLSTRVAGWTLHYDLDQGLIVTKEETGDE